MKPRIVFHVIAVIVLAAAVAVAQSPKDKAAQSPTDPSQTAHSHSSSAASTLSAREAGSGMATGRKSGSVVAADFNSVTTARETGSGMATGKRLSGDPHEPVNERNSAHATEALDGDSKDAAKMSSAQSNPLYKDPGTAGSNPLYQSKDKTAAPSGSGGNKPAEYKDGEDGTTHTRPGNHKPPK